MRQLVLPWLLLARLVVAPDAEGPPPAEHLRPPSTDRHQPSKLDQSDNITLSWSEADQSGIRYYLDLVRLADDKWMRIFGTYVSGSPFTLVHALPNSTYAWRIIAVDEASRRTPTEWHYFQTGR
jgi:hypothetical protein